MEHVGRYRLDERIGTGAFASVWRGTDEQFDIAVAVKVLAEHWVNDLDVRERFVSEAKLLRRIAHEHIVRVHDIGTLEGTPDGRPYFVMDYADAGTMADLLRHLRPPTEALGLCAQAARGVHALHEHGHVHRDIKPANLLLTTTRRGGRSVLIADLGLAKELAEMSGITVTAGSPAYMAPEQAAAGGFDLRADVYGLGAVTYAVLSGVPPFASASGVLAVANRSPQERPALLAARLDIDPGIDDLLQRTLAHDPDERPSSAEEFAEEVEALTGGRTMFVPAVKVAPRPPEQRHEPRPDLPVAQPSPPVAASPPESPPPDLDRRTLVEPAAPALTRRPRPEPVAGSWAVVLGVFMLATLVTFIAWRLFG